MIIRYFRSDLHRRAADYYAQLRTSPDLWKSIDDLDPQLAEFEQRIKAHEYDAAARLLGDIDENYLEVWGFNQRLIDMRQRLVGNISDQLLAAKNLGKLARAYHRLAQYDLGIEYNQRALELSRSCDDKLGQATWLNYIGINYNYLGNFPNAIEFQDQALMIAREIGDKRREAACLNGIANAYNQLSHYSKSLEYHQMALELRRELGNWRWESDSLNNIGVVYQNLGNYPLALEYFERTPTASQSSALWSNETARLTHVSTVLIEYGEYERAIDNLKKGLALTRDLAEWRWEDTQLGYLGITYWALGEYDLALEYFRQALDIALKTKSRPTEIQHLLGMGRVFLGQGDFEGAREYFGRSLKVALETQNAAQQLVIGTQLAELYFLENQGERALDAITQAVRDETPQYYHRAIVLRGIILATLKKDEEARSTLEQAIQNANTLLEMSPRFMSARYSRAVAIAGLSMYVSDENLVEKAKQSFAYALENPKPKGIIAAELRLLNRLTAIFESDTFRLAKDMLARAI